MRLFRAMFKYILLRMRSDVSINTQMATVKSLFILLPHPQKLHDSVHTKRWCFLPQNDMNPSKKWASKEIFDHIPPDGAIVAHTEIYSDVMKGHKSTRKYLICG